MNDSSALLVKYRGVSDYYVCADPWTSAFSDVVCRQLGYESVIVHLHSLLRNTLFLYIHVHCESKKVATILLPITLRSAR